jgi:2-isopropylmalate synthase, bacterial type
MDNNRVYIFDTTLRDGEQAPGYSMNIEEKIRVAKQLETLGVDIIEAGFAISSPGDFESVEAIAKAVERPVVASLARALKKDIDCAWNAVKAARHPRIHLFLATSDLHLEYKLKMSREEALKRIDENVRYAKSLCPDVEFSCEDATRTDFEYLAKAVEVAIEAGATTVNLPDTVGYMTPAEIAKMVEYCKANVKNIDRAVISMHCHNDLGLAVANTLSGVAAGARQIECTLCGIGERAGNAALEEVVMAMRTRNDVLPFETGIVTTEINRSAQLLSKTTGVKINPSKAIVGANAFAHESGIHQHGIMANSKTYEIMTPESVGVVQTNLVLGKHSGQHAFDKKLESLGFHFEAEKRAALFAEFKKLCDRKKTVTDRDILALADTHHMRNPEDGWQLEKFVVNSGNSMVSTACITLKKDGKSYTEVAMGTGPVYASLRCVEKIIKHSFSLEDYQLQAVTEHRDALGEALVKISDKTGVWRGRGVSTDVIEASILSCLNACNKMLDDESSSLSTGQSANELSFDMLVGHTDK